MSDEVKYESELEVVFSLMSDKELLDMNERLKGLIEEKAYQVEKFPLSCGEIRFVQSIVLFSYWMRRGQGVRIVGGEIVVCDLGESPFVTKYKSEPINEVPIIKGVEDGEREIKGCNEGDGEWV